MAKPRALITGVNGQDGSYLAELLGSKGYELFGTDRSPQPAHLARTVILEDMYVVDLMEPQQLGDLILAVKPNEVYHLAAHHFSSQTDQNRTGQLRPFINVNLMAANSVLETIRLHLPESRFFYAASSHIFGTPEHSPQTEQTPHNPETPYAITKSTGVHLCRYFRKTHGVFASVGIMYNHESVRRGNSFITTQLARAAALASLGNPDQLHVQDFDACVDWGASKDYVLAMWLMLQQETPDEYVVASGVGRSIREFADVAFKVVDLSYEDFISGNPGAEGNQKKLLVGDSSRLKEKTSWSAQIDFNTLVESMVRSQIEAFRHVIQ